MKQNGYKIGDIVRHKVHNSASSPPQMTVHALRVNNFLPAEDDDAIQIVCKYYNAVSGEFVTDTFNYDELERIPG